MIAMTAGGAAKNAFVAEGIGAQDVPREPRPQDTARCWECGKPQAPALGLNCNPCWHHAQEALFLSWGVPRATRVGLAPHEGML